MKTEQKAHAKLSPSSAARWIQCPGSASMETATGRTPVYTTAADEGTAQHLLLERFLKEDASPLNAVGSVIGRGVTVTEDMARWVQEAIDWLQNYRREKGGVRYHSEQRMHVYRAFGVEEDIIFGTADVVGWPGYHEALVFDYKGGYSPVRVEDSHQLRLYAIGLQASVGWLFDTVRLVIHQPRAGGASELVVTKSELESLVPWYKARIDAALDPLAPLRPSETACRFCPAAAVCPALQQAAIEVAQKEFQNPAVLTPTQLAEVLQNAGRIRAALEAVESHALHLMRLGQGVPGFKLVEGTSHRKWIDDEGRVESKLVTLGVPRSKVYTEKLITPAQAEKLIPKEKRDALKPFIVKPTGQPVIAPEDDARPALAPEFSPLTT